MDSEVNKNGYASTTTAQHLQDKLNDDKTAQAIDRLLDRIDVLENAVSKLSIALEQGPGLMAMTIDMMDEEYRNAAARGVIIEDRLKAGLEIAEKITAPEMVEKLNSLLVLADQAPGLIAMAGDMFDEELRKWNDKNIDIKPSLELLKNAAVSIQEAKGMTHAKVGGFFSILRSMRDPDRQKALGYLMDILKAIGQKM